MKKLFFVDLEMTGLDVETNRIIEVAVLITDLKFNILERYTRVISCPRDFIDKMDAWNRDTHSKSGLINEIPRGKNLAEVEMEMGNLAKRHFPDEKIILCGNSISLDKQFLQKYMPRFSQHLHYRIIDISSFKAIFQWVLDVRFGRGETHRALDDAEQALTELKLYLSLLDRAKVPALTQIQGIFEAKLLN